MFANEMLDQFMELQGRDEVSLTGIVIALLSMSAISLGWNRSLADLGDLNKMVETIHKAGVNGLTPPCFSSPGAFYSRP